MFNIVTSICIDEDKNDENVSYPSTLSSNSNERRIIYWKSAVVLAASALRCNPDAKFLLYTNDNKPLVINNIDIKQFIKDLGVEIRYLPFIYFKPPSNLSLKFKNAFYKLDVVKELGEQENTYNILLDSDCVWIKHNAEFNKLVESENILLYDVYQSYLKRQNIHYHFSQELGKVYKDINPDYPNSEPIRFGGELIAGSNTNLKYVANKLKEVFDHIVITFKNKPPTFSNNDNIFHGDEFIMPYVLNNMPIKWIDTNGYIRRLWTRVRHSTTGPEDLNLTIWHMPFEKTQGLPLLFDKVLNKNSAFWHTPLPDFNIYLGKYLGVPNLIGGPARTIMLTSKYIDRFLEVSFDKFKNIILGKVEGK